MIKLSAVRAERVRLSGIMEQVLAGWLLGIISARAGMCVYVGVLACACVCVRVGITQPAHKYTFRGAFGVGDKYLDYFHTIHKPLLAISA